MTVRFLLNFQDEQRGIPWEHRSTFLFYFEFIIDCLKLIVYTAFFITVVTYYGVPLHIIRDLYLTIRSFMIKVKDIVRYRRATANMNEKYPDATQEEIRGSGGVCIICREEMISAKRLPCGHLFHFRCLRSWLERQQACPTCRQSILDIPSAPLAQAPDVMTNEPNNRDNIERSLEDGPDNENNSEALRQSHSRSATENLPVVYIPKERISHAVPKYPSSSNNRDVDQEGAFLLLGVIFAEMTIA